VISGTDLGAKKIPSASQPSASLNENPSTTLILFLTLHFSIMTAIKQNKVSEGSESPQRSPVNIVPVPYYYPVTPMYNYGPFVGNQISPVPTLNSEFEKMVQEINMKYGAQGLSESFGMLLANPPTQVFQRLEISPPVTPIIVPDRTFVCPFTECGKNFTTKQSLKSHMAIHDDDKFKPFDCTLCGNLSFFIN
jgi:hypothetical protein